MHFLVVLIYLSKLVDLFHTRIVLKKQPREMIFVYFLSELSKLEISEMAVKVVVTD